MERQRVRRIVLMISLALFPLTYYYFSPYLIIEGASAGIVTGSFLVFSLLFFSSLVLGRGFCGWICPAGSEQELLMKVRNGRFKGGWRDYIKFLIWVPWLTIIVLMFMSAGGIRGISPFYQTWNGISISGVQSLVLFLIIAAVIGGIALATGRRGSCHTICWMSPFMILGTFIRNRLRVPSLHLEAKRENCMHCGICTRNCPMSLDVEGMVGEGSMLNRECILCAMCVDSCPGNVISLEFGTPR